MISESSGNPKISWHSLKLKKNFLNLEKFRGVRSRVLDCVPDYLKRFSNDFVFWVARKSVKSPRQSAKRCVHTDKNLVIWLGTTLLCDIKRVGVKWTVWATWSCDILCCATKIVNRQMSVHFKRNSCDIMVSQRCALSDVIWTYFYYFLRCSRAKFIKKLVDVWTLVAQQLFAWHILCRATFLYKVVWLNCCPCGRTLRV